MTFFWAIQFLIGVNGLFLIDAARFEDRPERLPDNET
jgi:hypothetical protein